MPVVEESKPKRALLTVQQVARAMSMSPSSIYQLARQGRLPFDTEHIGRSVRFRRTQVEEYLGVKLDD